MTLLSAALVAAIVLAISAIRSIRRRALVYAMPLPITMVLLTTATRVDGSQLLGVVLLNVFVAVVALLHGRTGWHILAADAAGVAAYLGLSWPIAALAPIPFLPTLATVCVLWLTAQAVVRSGGEQAAAAPTPPERLAKVGAVVGSSLLVVAAGRLINGLAVTFPYSGVLTVIETRRHLSEFARHFARNSIALVAFFTAYWMVQDHSRLLALGGAWLAFAVTATVLNLGRIAGRRTRQQADAHG